MENKLSYHDVLRMMQMDASALEGELLEELKSGIVAYNADVRFSYYERIVDVAETNLMRYPEAARRLHGCARAFVGVSTIGQKASDRIARANDEGDYLGVIAYDLMANYYVSQFTCSHIKSVREDFIRQGLYFTKEITPGNNCDLSLQKEIFGLLPDAEVKITDSLLMVPIKSLSYVYGITDVPNSFGVSHDCSECMSKNCPYRNKARIITEAEKK